MPLTLVFSLPLNTFPSITKTKQKQSSEIIYEKPMKSKDWFLVNLLCNSLVIQIYNLFQISIQKRWTNNFNIKKTATIQKQHDDQKAH